MTGVKTTFIARLKGLRETRKMSQAATARMICIPQITYARYEAGERTPDIVMLGRICEALQVSPLYLLGMSETIKDINNVDASALGLTEDAIETLRGLASDESAAYNLQLISRAITSGYLPLWLEARRDYDCVFKEVGEVKPFTMANANALQIALRMSEQRLKQLMEAVYPNATPDKRARMRIQRFIDTGAYIADSISKE